MIRSTAVLRLSLAALVYAGAAPAWPQDLRLPSKKDSTRFAVIGDTGTASTAQHEVGKQMVAYHAKFPFEFVIMLGDNLYGGSGSASDLKTKFEEPYAALLEAKVKFYAALGNHDNPSTRNYKNWNMGGQRFYTFSAGASGSDSGANPSVRFFVLDSNYLDKAQLDWLDAELKKSKSEWKIAFFHHPLYSSGRKHGSNLDLRSLLEPLFVEHGVKVVFAGHDHFYERTKPQKGIYHFVAGAGGSLRKGDINRKSGFMEVGFDTDYSFMLVEIAGREMSFQAISRIGQTIDSGVIPLGPPPTETPASPSPSSRPGAGSSRLSPIR